MVALSAGLVAPARVDAKPSVAGGNGNAAVAGTKCERALQRIAGAGALKVPAQREAYFACSANSIVVEVKGTDKKSSEQLLLGNTQTAQTRSIRGLGRSQRDRAATELGVADSGVHARAGVPSNSCMVGPEPSTYVDSPSLAHGNADLCYGRFIVRGGVPVEIVWSDTLSYVLRQNLVGTRTIQGFTVQNISTNQAYEIGVSIQWNQRKTVSFGSDPYIGEPETVEIMPFDVGDLQPEEYYPSHDEGTYHLTNDYTTVHVLEGPSLGVDIESHQNMRMPDFQCPKVGDGQCNF